jgi:hypothetical protein
MLQEGRFKSSKLKALKLKARQFKPFADRTPNFHAWVARRAMWDCFFFVLATARQ